MYCLKSNNNTTCFMIKNKNVICNAISHERIKRPQYANCCTRGDATMIFACLQLVMDTTVSVTSAIIIGDCKITSFVQ